MLKNLAELNSAKLKERVLFIVMKYCLILNSASVLLASFTDQLKIDKFIINCVFVLFITQRSTQSHLELDFLKMLGLRVCIVSQIIFHVRGKNGCRDLDHLSCVQNKTLTGHVISNFSLLTPALQNCQHQCFLESKCVSYNLGPVRGYVRPCELNAADHSTRPTFLVTKNGYEYCAIRNPCSSNPCPSDRLCTPDLSWNTFNCNDGGWTQWSSWTNCSLPSTCKRKNRTRSCTSPAPQKNGADCAGPDVERRECPEPLINITDCENPLGIENGCITKDEITASSTWTSSKSHDPWNARLNQQKDYKNNGAWAPAAPQLEEYLQIDLGCVKIITKVATQGRPFGDSHKQWVTKYSLSYSNDTKKWLDYGGDTIKVFPGNTDRTSIVTNRLEVPIRARHIRLIVKGFHSFPNLRMELYGCALFTTQ